MMVKKRGTQSNNKSKEKEIKAFIASFFTIIGFIIAIVIWRNEKYVMYYAKHGLILFIGQVIIVLIGSIPSIGWFISLLWIFWAVLWIISWINSLSGKEKRVFIITELAEKINI